MVFVVTQILGQQIDQVPKWANLPYRMVKEVIEMKRPNKSKEEKKEIEFEADEYSEEAWVRQFGSIGGR